MDPLTRLAASQAGTLARHQALEHGLADHDIRRRLRRREWAGVHPGVYVDHTGPLTGPQRRWAAVLSCEPSVLWGRSALLAHEHPHAPDDGRPVHVAVARHRFVRPPEGVVCHRVSDLASRALLQASPPRQRYDDAVIDLAATARGELDAIALVARAVADRRTTAGRLAANLAGRQRVPRRAFLTAVLADVAGGTCSVLEHGYLTRVERPHGLPHGTRQLREVVSGAVAYRDVSYDAQRLLVELDGRALHGTVEQTGLDLDRDLVAAVGGRTTVRVGWGQVFARPCATARGLGALLRQRGWRGEVTRCGVCAALQPPGGPGAAHSA